jgi:cytochrome c oxidase cbb3-type subunit 3
MLRCAVLLAAAMFLVACGNSGDDGAAPAASTVPPPPADESIQLTGKQAYDQVCARCHEEGVDGAPRTGDRSAWEGRSWLWEAVLFEHAKSGYMDMPAKGGDESLDDAIVEMAAEYMLTQTFPDVTRAD